jgi:PadR family transcriptional regulator, regulatory protein PadR
MASKALVAASAKPIVLSLLLSGESYGYRILERVRRVTGGKLEWSSAMLYPVLHRLERDGLIQSHWKLSEEGRMRKYYSLTVRGREALLDERAAWMDIHKALAKLWKPVESSD